jgi:hypothetical protein
MEFESPDEYNRPDNHDNGSGNFEVDPFGQQAYENAGDDAEQVFGESIAEVYNGDAGDGIKEVSPILDPEDYAKDPADAPNNGVFVQTMNGRQELVVSDRYSISWSPQEVDGLGEERVAEFQVAMSNLMSFATDDIGTDEASVARASAGRQDALMDFARVMRIPGASITFPNRNTRYTSMDGINTMPEPIIPGQPMDEPGRWAGIPNPFNDPRLNRENDPRFRGTDA